MATGVDVDERDSPALAFFTERPVDTVAVIFSSLSATDVVRFSTCTSNRIGQALAVERDLWSRTSTGLLRNFTPAAAFFDGPDNRSCNALKGNTMVTLFPTEAAAAVTTLRAAVAHAGAAALGATWSLLIGQPRSHSLFNHAEKMPTLLGTTLVKPTLGASTVTDFSRLAEAYACEACGKRGGAERQCAACARLLCWSCVETCDLNFAPLERGGDYRSMIQHADSPFLFAFYAERVGQFERAQKLLPAPKCGFSLCHECDDNAAANDATRSRDDVVDLLLESRPPPALYAPVCNRCDAKRALCPAHVDLCILTCRKCGDAACIQHSCETPFINNCFVCQWTVCYRDGCFDSGRSMRHCSCSLSFVCTECAPDDKCPECGDDVD